MSGGNGNASRPTCRRANCDYFAKCRGLCAKHYKADLRQRIADGDFVPGFVDPARAREHVQALRSAGISYARIGELAGMHPDTIAHSLSRYATIYANTEARLLRIPIPAIAHRVTYAGTRVNAIGSTRRLQSLVAFGYTQRRLADRLGVNETNLDVLINGKQKVVTAGRARDVERVFNELQTTPGGSMRAIRKATRMGWAPPAAWDDDTIDDPHTSAARWQPNAKPQRLHTADWLTQLAQWRSMGMSDDRIAADMGITVESMMRRLDRAGVSRNHGLFGFGVA